MIIMLIISLIISDIVVVYVSIKMSNYKLNNYSHIHLVKEISFQLSGSPVLT